MKTLGLMIIVALIAGCSAYGESKQAPVINGVPIQGGGLTTGHM